MNKVIDTGLTRDELIEAITYIAFCACRPNAMTAIIPAKNLLEPDADPGEV